MELLLIIYLQNLFQMSDLDAETGDWLSSLKLGDKLQYLSDFENGYYMGVVFEKLNLARGRKFKNTKDMACKFQNFKNVKDLLYQNFKVDFPIQNILYNTQQLLKTLRDCCRKYNTDKKQATMKKIESFSVSKIQPHEQKLFASRQREIQQTTKMSQTSKFPKKIQQIEHKLQKYREIKTKHELMALEDRKNQLEQNRRLIEEQRSFEINKVRANHQFKKEQERKVYDIWMKTEQVKMARVEKDSNLNRFLQEKKSKFYESLRNDEEKGVREGLEAFHLNCIRQGIELEHDPNKPSSKTEQNFNKQVVLERIKDNIKIHEKEKKERIKRENKKAVDAKEANLKSEAVWNQNTLVESYGKKMEEHLKKCTVIEKEINRQNAEKKIGREKLKNRAFVELSVVSQADEDQRKEQYRKKNIQYLSQKVERLERRQHKHKIIAENVLQAILNVVIDHEEQYYDNKGFRYGEWKNIEKEFLNFEKKDTRRSKEQSRYIDSSYDSKAKQYINLSGPWSSKRGSGEKLQLSTALSVIISKAYPMIQSPKKSEIPLYMPLKMGLLGDRLAGKTTISQKLSLKYGIVIINPQTIITEALQLNKEQVVEDPKKKKDSKKPQEQNPQKIALKQWGGNLMKRLLNPLQATIDHYLEAIEFKLKLNFKNKSNEQILKEYEESRVLQTQRYNKSLKEYEQLQKKGKKDSKKGGQQIVDQPPSQRKYFYTKGFIIDGIDLTLQNLRSLQKRLNGFISFQERVNPEGEAVKEMISNVIFVPKAQKDNNLQSGSFDLLIELQAKEEILEARQVGDKQKISHKEKRQIEQYYSVFGNKIKSYCKVQNQASIQLCLTDIYKIVESHLDSKYSQIQNNKPNQEQNTVKKDEGLADKSAIETTLQPIKRQLCTKLIKRFTDLYNRYFVKIAQSFSDYDSLRDGFEKQILGTQQAFMGIINRPDDKAGKILNFQENYNKLLSEKTNIVKDVQASKHLISKLDELNDGLWTSLESKKNEAVLERQKTINSNLLNSQIQKIIEVSKRMIQNQLNLIVEIIFFLYNVNNAINGVNQDIPTEFMVLGIPPSIEPVESFNINGFSSKRLDYYTTQALQCLKQLPNWLKKKQKKYRITKSPLIDSMLAEFINSRTSQINIRIDLLRSRVKQMYLEYYCFFKVLVNKMDDWVILGIKYENDFVYEIYRNIKKNIQEAKKSNTKDLFVKQITDILHPISGLPLIRLPISENTVDNKLKILSYTIFMQQIKCLTVGGRIPFKLVQSYVEKRKKSKLLEPELLQIELDILQQYLVTDDYCNYKEVAVAMLLWNVNILDSDQLTEYQKILEGTGAVEGDYEFHKQQVSFDEFKIIPGRFNDQEEQRIMKIYLFQIFREEFRDTIVINDYIETLRLFVQLQAYKYGDTLMMMHDVSHKHIEPSS